LKGINQHFGDVSKLSIKYLKLEPLNGGGHWTAVLAKLGMKLKVGMKTVQIGIRGGEKKGTKLVVSFKLLVLT